MTTFRYRALRALVLCLLSGTAAANSGASFSGITAPADNAISANQNPAGLTRLDAPEWVGQALAFDSSSTFVPSEASTEQGRTRDDGDLVVPLVYYARPISDDWAFGFYLSGMSFGEDLDSSGPQRYVLDEWSLLFVNFLPSVAWQINDRLSIGGGVGFTYTVYELEQAVLNLEPGSSDGRAEFEADDVTANWHLGVHYQWSEVTRFGLVYRSDTDPDLSDSPSYSNIGPARQAIIDAGGGLFNGDLALSSTMPASLIGGVWHQFDNGVEATLDLMWLAFSDFGFSEVRFGNLELDASEQDFEDIFGFSTGVSLPVADRWKLKAGAVYLSEPIKDRNRTFVLRLDQMWGVGLGAEYAHRDSLVFGLNVNYMDFGSSPTEAEVPGQGVVAGRYSRNYGIGLDFTARWRR